MGERHTTMYCDNCKRQTSAVQPTANHVLHLLISFIACGFWIPVWILCAVFPGPKRCTTCGLTSLGGRSIGNIIKGVAVLMLLLFVITAFMSYSARTSSQNSPPAHIPVQSVIAPSVPAATEPEPSERPAVAVETPTNATEPETTPATSPSTTAKDKAASGVDSKPAEKDATVPEPAPVRTWTSSGGKFKTEAAFMSKAGDHVKLKKADGKIITVDATKLSAEDQQWLKDRANR